MNSNDKDMFAYLYSQQKLKATEEFIQKQKKEKEERRKKIEEEKKKEEEHFKQIEKEQK